MMSLRMMEKDKDWLEMVEEDFKQACFFKSSSEPYSNLAWLTKVF